MCLEFETKLAVEALPEVFTSEDTLQVKILQVHSDYADVELLQQQVEGFRGKAYSVWKRCFEFISEDVVPSCDANESSNSTREEVQVEPEPPLQVDEVQTQSEVLSEQVMSVSNVPMYSSVPSLTLPLGESVELIVVEVQLPDIMFCWRLDADGNIVLYKFP